MKVIDTLVTYSFFLSTHSKSEMMGSTRYHYWLIFYAQYNSLQCNFLLHFYVTVCNIL